MTGKEYLQELYQTEKKIKSVRNDIRRLEEAAGMSGSSLTGMPHAPSAEKSRLEAVAIKIAEKKKELRTLELIYREMREERALLLVEIEDEDFKTVLEKRYLKGQDWQDIIRDMHYSRRWIFELHDLAIEAFEAVLEKENKKSALECTRMHPKST